jgi:hypothetical protein
MVLVIYMENMPESLVESTSRFLKLVSKVCLPVGHQEMAPPF